jgi:hypothetical protein
MTENRIHEKFPCGYEVNHSGADSGWFGRGGKTLAEKMAGCPIHGKECGLKK